jgi:3-oxoadipate enol-lactonase
LDRVTPRLKDHADVLVYDCRGHGQSDKPDGPYTVERFADDLADLLDHVGWRSAMVCGASMGGTVAIAFAAAYPDRVQGLALFDTTCWYGPEAPAQWAERAQKAVDEGMKSLVGFQKTRWFSDGFREEHPDIVDRAIAVFGQ